MKLLALTIAFALAGCHLLIAPFVMRGYTKRDVPPKIEDPDGWWFDNVTDSYRVWVWTEEPVWAGIKHGYREGKYRSARATSNRPMVQIWLDRGQCRWTFVHLEQRRASDAPSDRGFSNRDTFSMVAGNTKQFVGDCKKLREMLVADERYRSIIGKL